MTFGLVAEWLSRRIKFGLSRFTIALGGYKLHLNYKRDPTKMKGVQGCADHNYHESDRISPSWRPSYWSNLRHVTSFESMNFTGTVHQFKVWFSASKLNEPVIKNYVLHLSSVLKTKVCSSLLTPT